MMHPLQYIALSCSLSHQKGASPPNIHDYFVLIGLTSCLRPVPCLLIRSTLVAWSPHAVCVCVCVCVCAIVLVTSALPACASRPHCRCAPSGIGPLVTRTERACVRACVCVCVCANLLRFNGLMNLFP